MRLLILYSLVNNGLKPKVFDEVRHALLQLYGFDKLLLLHNLQKLGALRLLSSTQDCWSRGRRPATSRRCAPACGWSRTASPAWT